MMNWCLYWREKWVLTRLNTQWRLLISNSVSRNKADADKSSAVYRLRASLPQNAVWGRNCPTHVIPLLNRAIESYWVITGHCMRFHESRSFKIVVIGRSRILLYFVISKLCCEFWQKMASIRTAARKLSQKSANDVVVLAAVRSPVTRAFKGGFKDAWPEDILGPVSTKF